jgi:hypothetical protein
MFIAGLYRFIEFSWLLVMFSCIASVWNVKWHSLVVWYQHTNISDILATSIFMVEDWENRFLKNVVSFLTIKPTRCMNFSNLFWKYNSTCFGQFLCPSSGVIHSYTQQWCMSYRSIDSFRAAGSGWNCSSILIPFKNYLQTCMAYTIAECAVNNSWWWTEELSETWRVSFPK